MSRRSEARRLAAAAPVFAALGDETRLLIVARLGQDGPASIARLSEGRAITRQAITKHLVVLEKAGVIRGAKSGRERLYELAPDALEEAKRCLDEVAAQWDALAERLRAHVEDD